MHALSEHERKQRAHAFLVTIRAVRPEMNAGSPASTTSNGQTQWTSDTDASNDVGSKSALDGNSERPRLSQAASKLLLSAGMQPSHLLTEHYALADVHPAVGRSALNMLLAHGLVLQHRVPRQSRGAQPILLEVTEAGWRELRQRGLEKPGQAIGRGGFLHDVYGRWIAAWARAQGYRCSFERQLGEKNFDVVCETSGGGLVGVEVCCSGSIDVNVQQALKAAHVAGICEIMLVFHNTGLMQKVQRRLHNACAVDKGAMLVEPVPSAIRCLHVEMFFPKREGVVT